MLGRAWMGEIAALTCAKISVAARRAFVALLEALVQCRECRQRMRPAADNYDRRRLVVEPAVVDDRDDGLFTLFALRRPPVLARALRGGRQHVGALLARCEGARCARRCAGPPRLGTAASGCSARASRQHDGVPCYLECYRRLRAQRTVSRSQASGLWLWPGVRVAWTRERRCRSNTVRSTVIRAYSENV